MKSTRELRLVNPEHLSKSQFVKIEGQRSHIRNPERAFHDDLLQDLLPFIAIRFDSENPANQGFRISGVGPVKRSDGEHRK
jgi:hypothetical protein